MRNYSFLNTFTFVFFMAFMNGVLTQIWNFASPFERPVVFILLHLIWIAVSYFAYKPFTKLLEVSSFPAPGRRWWYEGGTAQESEGQIWIMPIISFRSWGFRSAVVLGLVNGLALKWQDTLTGKFLLLLAISAVVAGLVAVWRLYKEDQFFEEIGDKQRLLSGHKLQRYDLENGTETFVEVPSEEGNASKTYPYTRQLGWFLYNKELAKVAGGEAYVKAHANSPKPSANTVTA